MLRFKDKYKDESLFAVGCGPSLDKTPLDKLQYTFAMNNIATITAYKNGWRPTFYWATTADVKRSDPIYKNALEIIDENIPTFVQMNSPLPDRENVYRMNHNSYRHFFSFGETTMGIPVPLWSDDPIDRVVHYRMSMYGLMQVACWMGFDPIYLVGCDLEFGPESHHADGYLDDQDWTTEKCYHENWWHYYSHLWIKHHTEKRGIQVYNASVGGKLDIYPRRDVNDLLC